MIEYILAIAFIAAMSTQPPVFVAAVTTLDACMAEAVKRNHLDERLRTPEVRAAGGEYVCLKVVRVGA